MSSVLDFLGETAAAIRGGGSVGEDLFDKEDIGEASFTELPDDPEAILIDPDISATINGVIESIQPRKRATHLLKYGTKEEMNEIRFSKWLKFEDLISCQSI